MTVSEQIRVAFESQQITVTQLSIRSGVSVSTIRNILHSRRNVGVENIMAVAAVLDLRAVEVPRHE